MRGKGEGAVYRVPKDKRKPLRYYTAAVELPPETSDGKTVRRRKVVRSKDKAKVIAQLTQMRSDLEAHGDLPSASQTCAQWFTYWLESLAAKEVRPKTIAGYRSVVNNHIIPEIGTVRLDRLTAAHIRRVHDRIITTAKNPKDYSKGFLSSTYALNAHRIMSASLTIAEREGRVSRNVAKLTSKPRKATVTLEVLDLDEAIKILEVAAREDQAELGARWATSLLSGARRGEVIGLERNRVREKEIDFTWQLQRLKLTDENGKPDVPADFEYRHLEGGLYLTRPKSDRGKRTLRLVDPLKSILHAYIAATPDNKYGLVWAPGGHPIDPDQDSAAWHDILAATGITRNVRLHDVRHTTVDLLYLAGVPEDLIMEIVGHSTISVTRGYKSRAKANEARLTQAMKDFSALLTPKALGDGSDIGNGQTEGNAQSVRFIEG